MNRELGNIKFITNFRHDTMRNRYFRANCTIGHTRGIKFTGNELHERFLNDYATTMCTVVDPGASNSRLMLFTTRFITITLRQCA